MRWNIAFDVLLSSTAKWRLLIFPNPTLARVINPWCWLNTAIAFKITRAWVVMRQRIKHSNVLGSWLGDPEKNRTQFLVCQPSTSCAASVDSAAFREPSDHTTRFDNWSTADGLSGPENLWYINGSNKHPDPFSMLLHRAGARPDTPGHGLIGKRLVWESASCRRRCSSFVAACARPWLPLQDRMTVRSPIPSRWSRPQTRPPGLLQSTTFTTQKVFLAPPGRPTESKSYSPVTLLAAPICGK